MHCPHCGKLNPYFANPTPNQTGVCVYCLEVVTVDDALRLVKTSVDELAAMYPPSEIRSLVSLRAKLAQAHRDHSETMVA